MHRSVLPFVVLMVVALAIPAAAQGDSTEEARAQANNPLANFRTFNFHNYYVPELTGVDDETANTFWLRYAQPFGKWLVRASLPTLRVPTGSAEGTSGLGDLNIFATCLIDTGKPGWMVGVGPQLTAPTAAEDETGTGKWQAGAAAILFNTTSPRFQWGGLLTWQTDFAGDSDRADTSVLAAQPFYILQLGNGLYFRGAPVWIFDLENNTYNVPIGAGIGKVLVTERIIYNLFVEPQFTILSRGANQPELQVFFGLNLQFKKKA